MKSLRGYNILKFGLLVYSIFAFLGISGMQIGVGIAFLGFVIFILEKNPVKFYLDENTKKIFIFLILFFVSNIISTFVGNNFKLSLIEIIEFYGQIFLMFFLFNIKEDGFKRKLLYIIIFFATLQASFGIIQYFTKFDFFRKEVLDTRVRGTFSYFNTFGGLLGMIAPLVYSFFIYESKFKFRILFLFSFLIILLGLVFSFTRGAWLGTVFGIFLVSFKRFRYKSFLLILFLLFFIFFRPVKDRLLQTLKEPFGGRKEIWATTFEMIKEKPIFGYGKANFRYVFYKKQHNFDEKGHFHPHNIWLTIAVDNGVIGTILFGIIVFYILKIILQKFLLISDKKYIVVGCTASILDFLIHGLVDNVLRGETGYLFWFLIGIVSSI
jgi:O-antigen ligase